jgi:hypothetical protein
VSAPHDRPRTRKRKPTGERRGQRRDFLLLAEYFDWLKAHPFPGDPKARDLAQALEHGEIVVARSNGRAIAGSGTGLRDEDSIRRKLRRERARQGQARPRGRPKKR